MSGGLVSGGRVSGGRVSGGRVSGGRVSGGVSVRGFSVGCEARKIEQQSCNIFTATRVNAGLPPR